MKTPLPRSPRREKPRLAFLGEVIGNFLMVNAMVAVMGALVVPNFRATRGATASANLDPTTGKPVLMALEGCELLARRTARPDPDPAEATPEAPVPGAPGS